MMRYELKKDLVKCPFREPCCMREEEYCTILIDTYFDDGKCHFRKLKRRGKNLYDEEKKNSQ